MEKYLRKFILCFLCVLSNQAMDPVRPIIVGASLEKCGTHLWTTLISHLIPGIVGKRYPHERPPLKIDRYREDDKFYYNHFHPTDKVFAFFSQDIFRGCFMFRDPRDAVLSLVNYVDKNKMTGRFDKKYDSMDFDQMFYELVLTGQHGNFYLPDHWRFLLRWREAPNFLSIRFEDLIGPRGGGNLAAQLKTILMIANHLGISLDEQQALKIGEMIFGNENSGGAINTFNKGQIGKWKERFSSEMKNFFKEHFGQLLIELGYEVDYNW